MRRNPIYADRARTDRMINWTAASVPVGGIQAAILRKLEGYRKQRLTPVPMSELARWFRATPRWALEMAVAMMSEGGRVLRVGSGFQRARLCVELFRPDGSLVDRIHCEDIDLAEAEAADMRSAAEPGERLVIRDMIRPRDPILEETFA